MGHAGRICGPMSVLAPLVASYFTGLYGELADLFDKR